jgi:type I restriction enzyme, R subunit
MITEADTCRKYVLPKLYSAGWNDDQISEQKSFTDGRIVVVGEKARRRPSKRADYLLRYARDFMLAVVEAKAAYKLPGDGLQQGKQYAEVLGLKFAYSTNGHSIIECDYTTGQEREVETFPKPGELWQRLRSAQRITDEETANKLLTPANATIGKGQRYYQEIAINRVIQAILQRDKRILLTTQTLGSGLLILISAVDRYWIHGAPATD